MRTTVRLHDSLLQRAKERAAEERRTLTSLIEEGLLLVLAKPENELRRRVKVPISKATGGVLPGVDLNRSTDLEDVMSQP
jgi:hypothetical protein